MYSTDINTLILILAVNKYLLGFLIFSLRSKAVGVKGIDEWAWGSFIMATGLIMLSLMKSPIVVFNKDYWISLLMNLLVIIGDIIFLKGYTEFSGQKLPKWIFILPIASFLQVTFFTLIYPSLQFRFILSNFITFVLYGYSAMVLLKIRIEAVRKYIMQSAVLYIFFAFSMLLRIVLGFINPPTEPLNSSVISIILFAIIGVASILLSFNLIMIITSTLNNELNLQILSKNKLHAIISHDLRNSVGNMVNNIEVLKGLIQNWDKKEIQEWTDLLESSASSSRFLLENLFNWSRSQLNEIRLNIQKNNIAEVIQQTVYTVKSQAEAKNQTLQYYCQSDIWAQFDIETIKIVLRNLLSNSIKFTPENGKIIISVVEMINKVEVIVSDNGVGIPQKNLEQLFNTKTYFSTHGTNYEKGSGFGLLLCKEFIKLNKGDIYISSIEGKGTEIRITLPVNTK